MRLVVLADVHANLTAHARYTSVEVLGETYTVTHQRVPYDDTALYRAFEQRQVPECAMIYRAFFGDRFGAPP
jgi:hypothetical protein